MAILLTLLALGAVVAGIFLLVKNQKKKEKTLIQQRKNIEIERDMLTIQISQLVLHSNHEFLAHLMVKRLKEAMSLGASPAKIVGLLKRLGIEYRIEYPKSSIEEQFRYKIQKDLYENFDDMDARCWMTASAENKQEDWNDLQGTVLGSPKHNGFVFDLKF